MSLLREGRMLQNVLQLWTAHKSMGTHFVQHTERQSTARPSFNIDNVRIRIVCTCTRNKIKMIMSLTRGKRYLQSNTQPKCLSPKHQLDRVHHQRRISTTAQYYLLLYHGQRQLLEHE